MKKLLFVLFVVPFLVFGQALKRSGYFGFAPAPIDERLADYLKLPNTNGAIIQQVFEHATAHNLGIMEKDVILAVNGEEITDYQRLYTISGTLKADDPISIKINRQGEELTLKGEVTARPVFTPEGSETVFGSVAFGKGRLRYTVQKPSGEGPYPLIYYIQGYPCGTVVDVPPHHPYAKTPNEFVKRGYAVLKVEKPGMGDSETEEDCSKITFSQELEAFRTGLNAIDSHTFIDKKRVTLFGHSLGGLIAPILAAENEWISAMILYGTDYQPWHDYTLDRYRIQLPWFGHDYVEYANELLNAKKALYQFFIEQKDPREISKDEAFSNALKATMSYDGEEMMFGRHFTFWQDLNSGYIMEKYLAEVSCSTLGIYGESDIAAIRGDEMERAVEIINRYHPEAGTYWSIPETNHHLVSIDKQTNLSVQLTPGYGKYLQENYNEGLIDDISNWLNTVGEKGD